MLFELGLYEQLINELFEEKLKTVNLELFYLQKSKLDSAESAKYLSAYLAETICYALNTIKESDGGVIEKVRLANKIIELLIEELPKIQLGENLITNGGEILEAIISKAESSYPDLKERVREMMPYTRLSQSELFTGSNVGISLESEIKKEILSSDEICWVVSFIKFSGIRIFKNELEEFTNSGKHLRIITTTYMGATDAKAIEFLSKLKNTEIKVSYNTEHERLHAKAYLFIRKSGFDTGYIGSSNLSRSALTNGLEWNLKVTKREIGHIIDKFKKTFETYWQDKDFEYYNPEIDKLKLEKAIMHESSFKEGVFTFFDLKPFPYQEGILDKLNSERKIHSRFKNLLVAATGTGKTVISAFDFKQFRIANPKARLLFVAHRKEILTQAQDTFRHVLKDANFGELWVDGFLPSNYDNVFASIQTLNTNLSTIKLIDTFYDFIIIDEVHHIAAASYRQVLSRFKSKILLGLTATPERMDDEDILKDFCHTIAAEIRLPEALNRKLLCPFQYFAISDSVDISGIAWKNGKYEKNELANVFSTKRRVTEIIYNCEKYLTDINKVRAIAFCANKEHANFMATKFNECGLKADYLTSDNAKLKRDNVSIRLKNKEINYLFVVDIFNEGVDLPEVDTVLFLRPTESLTIFLQQLGRGLRLSAGKECLTVLDFVGNSRPEYDFERKFRSLVGKTHTSIIKEIENDFPHLPLGCSIVLEKKAKEVILKNIKTATSLNKNQLVNKIRNFKHNSSLDISLKNFIDFYNIELPVIYKKGGWMRLCVEAKILQDFNEPLEREISRGIKKIQQCRSLSYFRFLLNLIDLNFEIKDLNKKEMKMALMFYYDIYQISNNNNFKEITLSKSLKILSKNTMMIKELKEVLLYMINSIDFIEKEIDLGFAFPLNIYSRYTRDQILVAMELHTFANSSSNREGVAENKLLNVEALFVTLKKSEKEYSPTTLYDDYAISEDLFHWQSQNASSPVSSRGKSYINHQKLNKRILIFIREQNEDEYSNTMGYVFLGDATFVKTEGEKPMNIEWQLKEPMPAYMWKESGKLAVG